MHEPFYGKERNISRMRKQCVPGLSSGREGPGNEASIHCYLLHSSLQHIASADQSTNISYHFQHTAHVTTLKGVNDKEEKTDP